MWAKFVCTCICVIFPQLGLEQYCFLVFMVICILVAVYIFFIIPETKNKTFLEIENEFKNGRKKKGYSTDGSGLTLLTTSM